ncbi:MAG: CHAP domain-containing protein [Coriobacteriia bacterium]|nr:CHAP domain-containing protein [Coriobacteriia bacterium]
MAIIVSVLLIASALALAAPTYDANSKAYAASYSVASEYDGLPLSTITNCVAFAKYKVPSMPSMGNTTATKQANINSYTPQVGAIAIYGYNHVSYVESISGNTIVTLNGGFVGNDGNFTGHIERISGTAAELNIVGYWVPSGGQTPAVNNPNGCLDHVYGGDGMIKVSGWAFDRDDEYANIRVDVYVGGPAGTGEHPGNTVAKNVRSDVNSVMKVKGNHGFEASFVTSKRGTVKVYVYAINIGSGSNVLIGTKDVTITNPSYGYLDSASDAGGAVHLTGWAFDKDHPNTSIDVHVYIGGPAGVGECHVIKANKARDDVNRTMGITGSHGFDATVKTNKRGTVQVYAYGISLDGAPLNNNRQLINVKTVTVTNPVQVTKQANPIVAKAKQSTVTFKYAKVKNATQSVLLSRLITVSKAKGTVTYAKKSGNSKISVRNGKLYVKKGLKKGTYAVKVSVTAKGNSSYKAGTKVVSFKVRVK